MENIETKFNRIVNDIEAHNKKLDDVIRKFIFSPDTLSVTDLHNLYV
jgi:hypothetical protein